MRPFDVQLVGGMVLHEGRILEAETGEGKTLVAVLPAVLAAPAGRRTHVLTFNDSLARRDAEWMGPIYTLLGLRVAAVHSGMDAAARRSADRACATTCLIGSTRTERRGIGPSSTRSRPQPL